MLGIRSPSMGVGLAPITWRKLLSRWKRQQTSMNTSKQGLATAYVSFASADEESHEYEKNFWAFDEFCDLCISQPDDAWAGILEVLSLDPGPRVLKVLAAGPMEELLVNHGQQIINQVEERAQKDVRV